MRESPALDVIRILANRGAEITYHDPHVSEFALDGRTFKSTDLSDEVLENTDLVVIITSHTAIDFDRVVAKSSRIFDTRNATRDVKEGREKIYKL
jgi:UDP-N-acetyl-D-glucosamine dehydrogenase